ncbi:hypothetical protein, partial [Pseudomonas viridiflava]
MLLTGVYFFAGSDRDVAQNDELSRRTPALIHRMCRFCCQFLADRRQAASYQTTCNLLKKRDFVGADRAAFRLSANTVFQ